MCNTHLYFRCQICLALNMTEEKEISAKKGDFVGRVNTLQATVGGANDEILTKLYSSQCRHFYGSKAWQFDSKFVSQFHIMWSRCSRRFLQLPYKTHTRYLPHLLGIPSSLEQVMSRFVKLVKVMLTNENRTVSYLTKHCLRSSGSIMNINLFHICRETGTNFEELVQTHCKRLSKIIASKYQCSVEDFCAIKAIKDLRQNITNGWTITDCVSFMNFICCY